MQRSNTEQVQYCTGFQPVSGAGIHEQSVDALTEGTADADFSFSQLHGFIHK